MKLPVESAVIADAIYNGRAKEAVSNRLHNIAGLKVQRVILNTSGLS